MIFFYTFYGMLCCWMAYRDACRIKESVKIIHWKNGATHLAVGITLAVFYGWHHFFGILALARLIFDTCLNIFRGLNPFYVPLRPASFVDKWEKKIFPSKLVADIFYLVILSLMFL